MTVRKRSEGGEDNTWLTNWTFVENYLTNYEPILGHGYVFEIDENEFKR